MVVFHVAYLHETGSNTPLGITKAKEKVPFAPLFGLKDIVGAVLIGRVYLILILRRPDLIGDPENFISAQPIVTPQHIQPE